MENRSEVLETRYGEMEFIYDFLQELMVVLDLRCLEAITHLVVRGVKVSCSNWIVPTILFGN
ncbi:hypothetical protein Sjap_009131 [Stephania japonica]|uniref:Uncharacterized protein n=1 Tax=Stephania japonica TaxID=461633 RepID=A0AAP0JQX7_9MAGN